MSEKLVVYSVKVTEAQFTQLKAIEKSLGVRREIMLPAIAAMVINNTASIVPMLAKEINAVTLANLTALAGNGGIKVETKETLNAKYGKVGTPETPKQPDKK